MEFAVGLLVGVIVSCAIVITAVIQFAEELDEEHNDRNKPSGGGYETY